MKQDGPDLTHVARVLKWCAGLEQALFHDDPDLGNVRAEVYTDGSISVVVEAGGDDYVAIDMDRQCCHYREPWLAANSLDGDDLYRRFAEHLQVAGFPASVDRGN